MTLRRRVLLSCGIVALVLFIADVALASTFRSYLLGRVDEQLATAADRLSRGRLAAGGADELLRDGGPLRSIGAAYSEYFLGVADNRGNLRLRLDRPLSRQGEDVPVPAPSIVAARAADPGDRVEPFMARSAAGEQWRMVARRRDEGRGIVLVGAPLGEVGATLRRMVAVLLVASAAVLAALAAVAWWMLRHGVRPLAAMTATAERIADGELSQRVADVDDRTEAGHLGRALNTMLGRIEDAFDQRAASEGRLRRFVADASHELRTPLTSIRGYAELYRAGGLADPAQLDDAMRRVEEEATRMGALVEDLLLLAKLDQGRALDRQPVRLDALVADAVQDARAVEPDRMIALRADPVQVIGDESRLRQAIANLLSNARVHTPAGSPVEVSVTRRDGWGLVEVVDQGPGMGPEIAQRVFERFYQADPARTRPGSGAGLGLAIAAGIAEAHGGRAEVDSAPGAGSRFRLRLPLDQVRNA
ncbi:MAG TPA: HAMP domain-containing sensor histidine kinase [Egibacteraceae bacterium]|nr:HAMP domain-containing sensor histidine kinase [Egibacteraceae bacterium]